MNMKQFRRQISSLVDDESVRPFVCDGSPKKADIFIVGINPAFSGFNGSFWQFWDDGYGFDLNSWIGSFINIRERQGKRRLTPTRNMIEYLREVLLQKGHRLLDTNVYMKETPRANMLSGNDKETDAFWFLVKALKPRFIHLHGRQPLEVFAKEVDISISPNRIMNVTLDNVGHEVALLATPHLSYQMSYKNVDVLASRIASELSGV